MRETRYVHRLPVTTPTLFPAVSTNVYLIVDQSEAVIVDAGYDDPASAQAIVSYLQSLGEVAVKGIVLTHHHKDHSPGAKRLVEQLQCPIVCHPFETESIEEQIHPYSITSPLEDGDTLQVGDVALLILHAPGHTRGHLNLWLEQERLLFTGDNVVGEGTTWIGPPDGNLTDYLSTLRRLQTLDPAIIAPGHGDMIRNPQEKIQFVIQRRLEREQQIIRLLTDQPLTVAELTELIYQGQVHPSVMWVAERTVIGHLDKLMSESKVRQLGQHFQLMQ
jgi:glyoxylase-like metal-dependent hydrolase (beta-lactamase superfamily II)